MSSHILIEVFYEEKGFNKIRKSSEWRKIINVCKLRLKLGSIACVAIHEWNESTEFINHISANIKFKWFNILLTQYNVAHVAAN